jgi:hypothetical protein
MQKMAGPADAGGTQTSASYEATRSTRNGIKRKLGRGSAHAYTNDKKGVSNHLRSNPK